MSTTTITEAEILSEVMAAEHGDLPPDVARSVLAWKFPRSTVAKINRLARSNQRGALSPIEREELERYLRVGNLLNLLQAKARLSLAAEEVTD